MPRDRPWAGATKVLAWVRRRSARNAAIRLLRNRALLALVGVYGFFAILGVIAGWSTLTGPLPPLASPSQRESVASLVGLLLVTYGAVVGAAAGSALLTDPIYFVDTIYTAPFSGQAIMRERLRFTLFGVAVGSLVLGFLTGDVVGRLLGVDPALAGAAFSASLLLWVWFCLSVGLAFALVFEGRARPWRGKVSAGAGLGFLAIVSIGLAGATGVFVNPVTSAVSRFGGTLVGALMDPALELSVGAGGVVVLCVLLVIVIGFGAWFWARSYDLHQSDSNVGIGLDLTVERSTDGGFLDRIQRRLRPRYRDPGTGGAALRGLYDTLVARAGAWWFCAFLAGSFGIIGAVALVSDLVARTPIPPFDSSGLGPLLAIGLLLAMIVPIFAGRLWPLGGLETVRLLPLPAGPVLAASVWSIVPLSTMLAAGVGLFVLSFGFPLAALPLLIGILVLSATASILGLIRGSWRAEISPGSTEGPSLQGNPSGMLVVVAVVFVNLFGTVEVAFSAHSEAVFDLGLGAICLVDLALVAGLRVSALRAISALPSVRNHGQ